jgi:formate hydrogenlyase subunit 6/NADH:ubiquinone oxidoreductase subunit I
MILIDALKNLFKKPFTVKHPKGLRVKPSKLFRGKHIFHRDKCIGCGLCEKYCPSNCIKVDKEKKRIKIRLDTCTFCGLCRDVCPVNAIDFSDKYELSDKKKDDLFVD